MNDQTKFDEPESNNRDLGTNTPTNDQKVQERPEKTPKKPLTADEVQKPAESTKVQPKAPESPEKPIEKTPVEPQKPILKSEPVVVAQSETVIVPQAIPQTVREKPNQPLKSGLITKHIPRRKTV